MATFKCYWPGGPFDPYRLTCLASYGLHGHSLELYCNCPPSNLPPEVSTHPIGDSTSTIPVEALLVGANATTDHPSPWVSIDVMQLQAKRSDPQPDTHHLSWVEAFKLWLPEYNHQLQEWSLAKSELPLHLSFAHMAGIDLHYMPPRGSFLDELLNQDNGTNLKLPRPVHDVKLVRQKIQDFLKTTRSWTEQPLIDCCGPGILRELQLERPSKPYSRIKRKIKSILAAPKKLIPKPISMRDHA